MFSLRIPITDTTVSLLSSYELKELNGCRLTGNQVLSVGWREALSPIHWEMLLPQQLPCHLCVSLSQLCRASQLAVRNRVPELTGWGQIRAVTGESGGLPLEKVLRKCSMDCLFAGEAEGMCILSNFYSNTQSDRLSFL